MARHKAIFAKRGTSKHKPSRAWELARSKASSFPAPKPELCRESALGDTARSVYDRIARKARPTMHNGELGGYSYEAGLSRSYFEQPTLTEAQAIAKAEHSASIKAEGDRCLRAWRHSKKG